MAGIPFHVMNRGAKKARLFDEDGDYQAFMRCLGNAATRVEVDLYAYCLMPNHFHLVVAAREEGGLPRFMKILLGVHSLRWHAHRGDLGCGAVYQGRYRAFPIQTEAYFYAACRYVERNPVRAGLVPRAEEWRWSSASPAGSATRCDVELSDWPVDRPEDWVDLVNTFESPTELAHIRRSAVRQLPLGDPAWVGRIAGRLGIGSRLRPPGRPSRGFG